MAVRRLPGAVAAAAAGAALLSGCGGQAAGSAAAAAQDTATVRAVGAAADTLVRAGSSRVTTAMREASGGSWLTITGTGGYDYAGRRGRLVLTLPEEAGARPHRPITELLLPGALYMKDRGEGVPPGEWVRVDTTHLPDGGLVTAGATDPLAGAGLLRGAREVRLVGREALPDGTRVSHYTGTADLARAARAAPAADRGPLEAAARGLPRPQVPFEAWLDARGRLRQLSQTFTYSASGVRGGEARAVTVVSTIRFDGFGTPVRVVMPRPADIWAGKIVSAPVGQGSGPGGPR